MINMVSVFGDRLIISNWKESRQSTFWKSIAIEYLVAVWYGFRYVRSLYLYCIFGEIYYRAIYPYTDYP